MSRLSLLYRILSRSAGGSHAAVFQAGRRLSPILEQSTTTFPIEACVNGSLPCLRNQIPGAIPPAGVRYEGDVPTIPICFPVLVADPPFDPPG